MQKDPVNRIAQQHGEQLVQAVKRNDESVLQQIYQQHFKKVELYVLRNNGDTDQAKDIYQEAFIAFWKNIKQDKFKPASANAIGGYLYTIAKNKWTDYLRSAHYRKMTSVEEHINLTDDLAETEHTAEAANEKLQLTMTAFEQLGAECKLLLTQFYFGKKSLNEIAKEFDIEPASVRNKKYRCMQRLRNQVFK